MRYELCLTAVKQNVYAFKYVKEPTPDKVNPVNPLQKVNHRQMRQGELLSSKREHPGVNAPLADKPFYDLGWRDGELLKIHLVAVQRVAIKHIKKQSPELCLVAIKNDLCALRYIYDIEAIADLLDEIIINEGLQSNENEVKDFYQRVVKIRESNRIAHGLNKSILDASHRLPSKLKL